MITPTITPTAGTNRDEGGADHLLAARDLA